MSTLNHDVIVIGSGPAGANAALTLADSGLDVLVLEKEALPRHKPCGGAMPSSATRYINVDISPVISNRTRDIKVFNNYEDELSSRTSLEGAPILVERPEFDAFLVRQAIAKGAGRLVLRQAAAAAFAGESSSGVSVTINGGETLQARYLVAADGASSKIARAIGLMSDRVFARSLESEVTVSEEYFQAHASEMVMNLFCLSLGYGWVFPKRGNLLSCGVGTWGEKRLNLREALKHYIEHSIPTDQIQAQTVKGFPIPIYQGGQHIASRRVLLVGDAAALVDPVSGEGIRYALLSGKLAAEAIVGAREGDVGREYQASVNQRIGLALTKRLKFDALAFRANPEFFYDNFVRRQKSLAYTG